MIKKEKICPVCKSTFEVEMVKEVEDVHRFEKAYQQGRAEAIDEYKEQLLENLIPMKNKYFNFAKKSTMPETYTHIKRMDTVNIIIEMVKIKAEQLKG